MHLRGKVRTSTFRWALAAILFDQLDVVVQGPMLITPASERALSEWMREHLSVAVHPHDERDSLAGLEQELLQLLDPPLELRHLPPTALRTRLTGVAAADQPGGVGGPAAARSRSVRVARYSVQ